MTYPRQQAMSDESSELGAERLVRLNKFISNAGIAARRKSDELIFTGRVTVNMQTVTEPGTKIDPQRDVVKVDGEKVRPQTEFIYVVLFKPRGYVTTTHDDKNRPTVMDLIGLNTRLYPIGRLDYDTDGVLLLTNDGEFANMMMHPRHKVFKTYFAKLDKPIEDPDIRQLKSGVVLDGKPTARAKVRIIPGSAEMNIWISIHEGRNRQVRRMLEVMGYKVVRLKRVEYARIGLEGLKPGEWRYLTLGELDAARKLATPKPVIIHKSPEEKTTKKKSKGKKKKKLEKLRKKMEQAQRESGSDVLSSIDMELDNIKEQIQEEKKEE
jgi:pseudouridine synthase